MAWILKDPLGVYRNGLWIFGWGGHEEKTNSPPAYYSSSEWLTGISTLLLGVAGRK